VLEFPELAGWTCMKNGKFVKFECFWALWELENEEILKVSPEGHMEEWKALQPIAQAAYVPKWAQRSQESIWE
jgi:hypothetical protein